jgi:hypothetical protein
MSIRSSTNLDAIIEKIQIDLARHATCMYVTSRLIV